MSLAVEYGHVINKLFWWDHLSHRNLNDWRSWERRSE